MIKTCPICKTEFESNTRQKYCSEKCRYLGERNVRKEWEARTDSKAKKNTEQRSKGIETQQIREQRHEQQEREWKERLRQDQIELERRAESGDYNARMKIAEQNKDRSEYWKYFALSEIENSEKYGRKSTRTVNDISVYEPNFVKLVIESIDRTGKCISRAPGLGERI